MRTTVAFCLFFITCTFINALPIDDAPPLLTLEEENKISKWTCSEHYHLWNGFLAPDAAVNQSNLLLQQTEYTIGYQELAKSLGYKPRPWSAYKFKLLSDEQINLEPTVERYFETTVMRRSAHVLLPVIRPNESVLNAAIEMLDKRDPVIRSTFKRIFAEARRSGLGALSKKIIDRMMKLLSDTGYKLGRQYDKKLIVQCENDVSYLMSDKSKYVALPTGSPTTSPISADAFSGPVDEDAELEMLPCFNKQENTRLLGNLFSQQFTKLFPFAVVPRTIEAIGLEELRRALGFPMSRPWTHLNETKPSEQELASAPTVQAYYELKEPRSSTLNLDDKFFRQPMFQHSIQFIDGRLPGIRKIYRRRLEKVQKSIGEMVDRKAVDLMLEEYDDISKKVYRKSFTTYNVICQNFITNALSSFLSLFEF